MIKIFITDDWDKLKSYCNDQRFYTAKIIPYSYLNKRLTGIASV